MNVQERDATASTGTASTGTASTGRWRPGLWILGLLAAATFWIPLWAPLVPIVALAASALAAVRRTSDRPSLLAAAGGGAIGLVLFLLLEYVWVV